MHLTDWFLFPWITRLPVKIPVIHYFSIHRRTQIEAQLKSGGGVKKWNFWELNYSLFPIQFRRAWNIYSQASKTVNHRTSPPAPFLIVDGKSPSLESGKTLSHAPLLVGLDSKSLHLLHGTIFFSSADFIVESNGSTVSGTLSIWKNGGHIKVFCRII